ncbi:MAG: hypothetical protein AB1540_11030 [Bdellovibrionota bacterium]
MVACLSPKARSVLFSMLLTCLFLMSSQASQVASAAETGVASRCSELLQRYSTKFSRWRSLEKAVLHTPLLFRTRPLEASNHDAHWRQFLRHVLLEGEAGRQELQRILDYLVDPYLSRDPTAAEQLFWRKWASRWRLGEAAGSELENMAQVRRNFAQGIETLTMVDTITKQSEHPTNYAVEVILFIIGKMQPGPKHGGGQPVQREMLNAMVSAVESAVINQIDTLALTRFLDVLSRSPLQAEFANDADLVRRLTVTLPKEIETRFPESLPSASLFERVASPASVK